MAQQGKDHECCDRKNKAQDQQSSYRALGTSASEHWSGKEQGDASTRAEWSAPSGGRDPDGREHRGDEDGQDRHPESKLNRAAPSSSVPSWLAHGLIRLSVRCGRLPETLGSHGVLLSQPAWH